MTVLTLDQVSVEVRGQRILHDISAEIPDRAFAGVAGSSGSGKTTLLRVIAGLQKPTTGRVYFDATDVTTAETAERDLGMAFQDPALIPTRRVERNVAFPLEIRRQTAEEIRHRVSAEARAFHIEHLLERKSDELSAGEAHLVQIARTLVRVPRALLLDEPLAALDEPLKVAMRRELAFLQQGYGVTTVIASNEPADFIAMCTHLLVLHEGQLVETGDPSDLRDRPGSLAAAEATGDLTVVTACVVEEMGVRLLDAAGSDGSRLRFAVSSPAFADRVGETVLVGMRPWAGRLDAGGSQRARVIRVVPWPRPQVMCMVAGNAVMLEMSPDGPEPVRDSIVGFAVDSPFVFDATSQRAID